MTFDEIERRISALEEKVHKEYFNRIEDNQLNYKRKTEDVEVERLRHLEDIHREWYIKWERIKYTPKFYGHNPLTGIPVTIVFNEPSPDRTSLMNWNPLVKSWFYSPNAGLNWYPVKFMDYLEKVDCLCDEPKYASR